MNIQWDGKKYADDFNFVPQYGEAVLDLITLPKGSFAVDLGCGNGALTAKLAERGYNVLGIDDSAEMLELAGRQHSDIPFRKENALTFHLDQPADIIFSNAVFHWINAEDQQTMLNNVAGNEYTYRWRVGRRIRRIWLCCVCSYDFGAKICGQRIELRFRILFSDDRYVCSNAGSSRPAGGICSFI